RSLARLYRWVVAAARAEAADGGDWRAIIDGLRPVTQPTWRAWSVEDRRRFHRHLDSLWSVHRHRMAPSIAARIDELRQAGRLDILAGRVLALDGADGAVTASLRPRGGTEEIQRTVDWVINTSGVRPAVSEPLVRTMQQSGLARPDLLARGLEVDPRGRVVGRNGLPSPGLFALGPLCAGTFLEITAVPDIREQCAAVAEELARRVTGRVGTAGLAVPRSAASQPC
ncbi:MAG TPA: pyridine nucleotide-disulfide oxidoreductase, partial [Bauldia sp.]|nr:pyridine nucleotide-disulfide oxidoreductase [Bauldia sp.]